MEEFNLHWCAYDNGHLVSWLEVPALEPNRSLEPGFSPLRPWADFLRSLYLLPFLCKLGIIVIPIVMVNFVSTWVGHGAQMFGQALFYEGVF